MYRVDSCADGAELFVAMSGNKVYNAYFIIMFQWS